jgi:transposase-like protein
MKHVFYMIKFQYKKVQNKIKNDQLIKMSIPNFDSIKKILMDEKECIRFLFENDILYKPKKCEVCDSKIRRESKRFRCVNKRCRSSITIFKDSFFAQNRIKCSEMMMISYFWLAKCSRESILTMTKHSPNTITNHMKYLRELIIDTLEDESEKIGGNDIIVEIDESKFGRRKYHRGKRVEGVWVIGGVEKTEDKRCFLKVVEKRNHETIKELIERYVEKGSIVRTDCWKGYNGIDKLGVTHQTINHSINFTDPETGVNTNTIEGIWNGIKLQIAPRNRNKELIENHLLEYIWRKKHKNDLWYSFIDALRTTAYYDKK